MKLNNKGFAFSTMLYGTLALITVILYMILGINQGANDETLFYGDEIQVKLNECVYDEIYLENCYSSHTSGCSATSYHACLGISDSNSGALGDLIAEKLKEKALGSGLYADPNIPNRYIYRGNDVNNYIQYSNKIWRILSIEPNGSIKMIDYKFNSIMNWDTNGNDRWATSTLSNYLNSNYLAGITDTSGLVSGAWVATFIRPSFSTTGLSISEYYEQYQDQESDTTSFAQVGLPTVYDYMNATASDECRNHMMTASGCSSWLSNYKGWTININGEAVDSNGNPENRAYYFGDSNKILDAKTDTAQKVFPVVVLDRNNVYQSGTGSATDPYVLK